MRFAIEIRVKFSFYYSDLTGMEKFVLEVNGDRSHIEFVNCG